MVAPPFGFGPSPDDEKGKKEPAERESGEAAGGQETPFEAFNQLGQMLSQLGQMLSQAGSSSGPVNYDLAKQIALQTQRNSGNTGESKLGFRGGDDSHAAVRDTPHLAEQRLAPAALVPAGRA